MNTTFNTTYKATGPTKSSIKVTAGALPSELHKMIVWVMHHQEDAAHLLPAYRELRQQCTERDEAQKTYCGQDI
jgi:hypothetical protein